MNNQKVLQDAKTKVHFYEDVVFKLLSRIQIGAIVLSNANNNYIFGDLEHSLHADLTILDASVFKQIFWDGGLGFADGYIEGKWQTKNLTKLLRVLSLNMAVVDQADNSIYGSIFRSISRVFHFLRRNNLIGARKNIAVHYDLGNDFFACFLDPTMMYSCAQFTTADCSLQQASLHKLDNICRKLELCATDHVLEIGTGWGGFAIYAAQNYLCRITTTTISVEQYNFVKNKVNLLGLENRINVLLVDYRNLSGQFDKLVSIEMIEAVGHQYFNSYFEKCSNLVKPQGLFLLQAILIAEQRYIAARDSVDFIKKYIFPGCCIPSIGEIFKSIRSHTDYNLLNTEDITLDYARTLRAWRLNFMENLSLIRSQGFSAAFINKWMYYFCYCEAGFLERNIHNMQILFSKPNYRTRDYALYKDN